MRFIFYKYYRIWSAYFLVAVLKVNVKKSLGLQASLTSEIYNIHFSDTSEYSTRPRHPERGRVHSENFFRSRVRPRISEIAFFSVSDLLDEAECDSGAVTLYGLSMIMPLLTTDMLEVRGLSSAAETPKKRIPNEFPIACSRFSHWFAAIELNQLPRGRNF